MKIVVGGEERVFACPFRSVMKNTFCFLNATDDSRHDKDVKECLVTVLHGDEGCKCPQRQQHCSAAGAAVCMLLLLLLCSLLTPLSAASSFHSSR